MRSRVRLVKQVVTEEVTHTFTLRREVLRVEEAPADPDDPADSELSWTDMIEGSAHDLGLEIVLHAEQLVTSTAVVPVERVRVGTRVVTTDVTVSTDLLREQVDLEQDPAVHHEQTSTTAGGAPTNEEEPA